MWKSAHTREVPQLIFVPTHSPASPQTPGFKQVQGNQQLPHKESSASPLLAVYVLAVLEKCVSLF